MASYLYDWWWKSQLKSQLYRAIWRLSIFRRTDFQLWSEGIRIPVVHENVWLPKCSRWDANVLHVVILRHIPPHVEICPFLEMLFSFSKDTRKSTWNNKYRFYFVSRDKQIQYFCTQNREQGDVACFWKSFMPASWHVCCKSIEEQSSSPYSRALDCDCKH